MQNQTDKTFFHLNSNDKIKHNHLNENEYQDNFKCTASPIRIRYEGRLVHSIIITYKYKC